MAKMDGGFMKLSEAILLGSTILKPKAHYTFYPQRGEVTHGCALGMMAAAHGCLTPEAALAKFWDSPVRPYAWAGNKFKDALPCGCDLAIDDDDRFFESKRDIQAAIMHVFNYHVATDETWTLERLCQWIDSIDPTPMETPTVGEQGTKEHAEVGGHER